MASYSTENFDDESLYSPEFYPPNKIINEELKSDSDAAVMAKLLGISDWMKIETTDDGEQSINLNYQDEFVLKLQDLISRIETEIDYCNQQKAKYLIMQRFNHKIAVLRAAKNYLCGKIGSETLNEYMRLYPKWEKAFGASNTITLINEAIEFKPLA